MAALAALAGMVAGGPATALASPSSQTPPIQTEDGAPRAAPLKPFGPRDAPFDDVARRALATDTLVLLWELHGLRAARHVFSLPSTPVLGTIWEVGEPRWQFTIPAGFPIYLIAYASVNRSKYDPALTRVTVDGVPLAGLADYLYTGLRAPVGTNIHDHDVIDLVFAPPRAGTYRIEVRRPEFTTEYHLTVMEPIALGPLVLRDPQGALFALHGEQRRALPDLETAQALGFRPRAIKDASPAALALLPEGPPIPSLRDGLLVKGEREHVFRLASGRKRWLATADEFRQALAEAPDPDRAIQVVDTVTLQSIAPELRHNTLLMSTAGDIYHVDNGDLRYVKDWEWLAERKLRLDDVWRIPDHLFALLPFNRPHGPAAGITRQDQVFYSETLGAELPYRVYLPPGYAAREEQARRYPVIYLLHGRGAHYDEWTDYGLEKHLDQMFLYEGDKWTRVILVLPQGATGYWANQQGGPQWSDYVARDLVAHVDATYRTLPLRRARGIGGLSMGGFGALLLAFKFPDLFGVIGARGPALYPQQNAPGFFGGAATYHQYDPLTLVRESRLDGLERPPYVWLDVGASDPWKPRVELLRELLQARKWPLTWNVFPGEHDRGYWGSNVREFLAFFLDSFARGGGASRLT